MSSCKSPPIKPDESIWYGFGCDAEAVQLTPFNSLGTPVFVRVGVDQDGTVSWC